MANNDYEETTDPSPQPSTEGRLAKIEEQLSKIDQTLNLLLAGQARIFQEMNERYVDLRNRIDLNNDKLGVVQRELNQFIKDTRNPAFPNY